MQRRIMFILFALLKWLTFLLLRELEEFFVDLYFIVYNKSVMSYLTPLLGLYCPSSEDYYESPESAAEYAAKLKAQQELEERKKHNILNVEHFNTISRPESSGGGASGVKVLRDKTGVLHFMDTKAWAFHYQFCVSFLGEKRALELFNSEVYTGKDRSMMFATIVAYPKSADSKIYCIELNPADPMVPDLKKLDEFFMQVNGAFMVEQKQTLYFHPTSAIQIEATRGLKLSLPIVQSSEIFGDIPYKVGYHGIVTNKYVSVFDKQDYTTEELQSWLNLRSTEELVVIPSVPNDIPAVGGIICKEFIPPLCHVALLCQNRRTPYCYYNYDDGYFKKVQDMVVSGVIASSGFYLDGTSRGSKAQSDPVEPPSDLCLKVDTLTPQLIDLGSLKASQAQLVGAKASQLAQIDTIYGQPIFKGTFTVPFYYCNKHLNKDPKVLKEHLHPLLSKLGTVTNSRPVDAIKSREFDYNQFSTLVDKLVELPIDAELVQTVIDKIVQNKWTSVIFRSSTNAEDIAGFNGAGLYESVPLTGEDVTNPEKIGHALKTVWASLWSPKAVKERQYYKIDYRKVHMAVLVQPYIRDSSDLKVILNGVCITHDASRHKVKHGFVVHTYPGSEHKVTNFYKDATPESLTLLLGRQKDSVDMHLNNLCSKSTGPLMTQSDAVKVVEVFGKLHNTMLHSHHSMNNTTALDIEFMIVDNKTTSKERELVVLQARPYSINVAPSDVYDIKVRAAEYVKNRVCGVYFKLY